MKKNTIISTILFCSFASAIALGYSENDKAQLIATKVCINCDLENLEFNIENDFNNNLDSLNVSSSNLKNITIKNIGMNHAIFADSDLSYANLDMTNGEHNSSTEKTYYGYSSFTRAIMNNTTLLGKIIKSDFVGADLSNLNTRVNNDLYDEKKGSLNIPLLVGFTDFSYAKFTNANLYGHSYINCNFSDADLSQANLQHAMFLRVNLSNASFKDSNLNSANFDESQITKEQIKEAANNCEVVLPSGQRVVGNLKDDGHVSMCPGRSYMSRYIPGHIIL